MLDVPQTECVNLTLVWREELECRRSLHDFGSIVVEPIEVDGLTEDNSVNGRVLRALEGLAGEGFQEEESKCVVIMD